MKILIFIEKNIKLLIAFILGITISVVGVFATSSTLYNGDVVSYDSTNSGLELDGVAVDNVQDAIDALHEKSLVCRDSSVNTINFTIGGVQYTAEEGMKWTEWIGSSYDTSGGMITVYCDNSTVLYNGTPINDTGYVISTSTIISGYNYFVDFGEALSPCGGSSGGGNTGKD